MRKDNDLSMSKRLNQETNTRYHPLVSIITAVLNRVNTVEKCFNSTLNQDYDNIEHIFIDGVSTDGTVEMLSSYSARFPGRIKFISEPDNAPDEAANKGIKIAEGEIFGAMGADDWLEPGAISAVVDFFESHPDAHFVYGDCYHCNEKGDIRAIARSPKEVTLKALLNQRSPIWTPSLFYRREVFDRIGFYCTTEDTSLMSDVDWTVKAIKASYPMYRIEKVLSSITLNRWYFRGEAWDELRKRIYNSYSMNRKYGGSRLSWYARIYYASLMVDWLRPVFGPLYPIMEKIVNKHRLGN